MEYHIYNKINCSLFDLMSRDVGVKHNEHEPNQTKGLGYLLAKSTEAMKAFCSLVGERISKGDRWIVDCEMMGNSSSIVLQRIDILIRITDKVGAVRTILLEAKSFNSMTSATCTVSQAIGYCHTYSIKVDKIVSLTHDYDYSNALVKTAIPIVMIRWRDVLNALLGIKRKDTFLIEDFISYLMKNNHIMNYYDDEVLTIPANASYPAVIASHLYICPGDYSITKKTPLFVAFRGRKGKITELYKVQEKIIINPNDSFSISMIEKELKDFGKRMNVYLDTIKTVSSRMRPASSPHCVFYLDIDSKIVLPNPVYIKTNVIKGKGSGVRKHTALPLKAMFVNKQEVYGKIIVTPGFSN